MKGVVALRFLSSKNCLGTISSSFFKNNFRSDQIQVYRVSAGNVVAYFSSTFSSGNESKNEFCINGIYGSKLGFTSGCGVLVESVEALGCASAWIEPVSVDDWEILEIHAAEVETQLLDQIRVLWPGQIFPLWIGQGVCIFLKTVKIEPAAECSLLVSLSELIIQPKIDRYKVTNAVKSHVKADDGKTSQQLQSPSNATVLPNAPNSVFQLFYTNIVSNFFRLLRFVFFVLCKHIPLFIYRLQFLMYSSIFGSQEMHSVESRKNWEDSHVKNVPQDFCMVARVEPVLFEQSNFGSSNQFLSNQPNTVFLHSNTNLNNCQPDVCLVLISKIMSPCEKLMDNRSKKTKTDSDHKNSNLKSKINTLKNCVVRMYLHPYSKYAMISNWKLICKSHHLKVPLCVRRQMNLSVSSKVYLQRLSSIPKSCTGIKSISFEIISSEMPLALTSSNLIVNSFKDWIESISDFENPIPVTVGAIFIFTLLHLKSEEEADQQQSQIEVVITRIEAKNTEAQETFDSSSSTFLLSGIDLIHIELNFNSSNQENFEPVAKEVDFYIPPESALIYSKGLEEELKTLEHFIEMALASKPLSNAISDGGRLLRQGCALVTGAKGTGKSVLCRALLNKFALDESLHAYIHVISCGQWRGKKPESVRRHCSETLHELLWRQPSVLLLDDLDQLLPASFNSDEEKTPDSVYTLQLASVIRNFLQSTAGKLTETWAKTPQIAVLVTSKSKTTLLPIMTASGSHLFSLNVHIELPNLAKRQVLLQSLIQSLTDYQSPVDLHEILEKTEGFAAGDLVGVIRRSNHLIQQKKYKTEISSDLPEGVLPCGVVLQALRGYTPASLQNAKLLKPLPLTWRDVGGLHMVTQKLKEQLMWPVKYRHLFSECGLQPQSGVLLFGPPGCGKTLIASVVASECGLNFISIKGPEVLSKYIGASEAAVRDLFARAKAAAPCVLFFDEFDSLAPKRGHDSTGVTDRVVNQLLTHLDGVDPLVGVTVMAASSRPDLLDPALLRPGRLDHLMYCPFPNAKERKEILQSLSNKVAVGNDVDFAQLADACDNFSGADLKALLYNAQLEAVHESMDLSIVCSDSSNPSKASTETISSVSQPSSNLPLEHDDIYQGTGYSSLEEQDGDSEKSLSSDSVEKLKVTAADLIKSIEYSSGLSSNLANRNSYKMCFDEGVNVERLNDCTQGTFESKKIVYFSTLHRGRCEKVPPYITESAEAVFEGLVTDVAPQEKTNKSQENLVIKNQHFERALVVTRPSVTLVERQRFEAMYSSFIRSRERGTSERSYYADKMKTTLS